VLRKVFIIPYFGTLPNYFNIWMLTAGMNSTFDFIIITDNAIKSHFKNIKIINCSFEKIQKRVYATLGDEIVLESPYKLNDYRPAFSLIFENEIKNYDYWGFMDVDTILGNLGKFYTDEYIESCERVGTRGHLQLFRNSKKTNDKFLMDTKPGFNFSTIKKHKFPMHFDEMWGINYLFQSNNCLGEKLEKKHADVSPKYFFFRNLNVSNKPVIFEYKNGELSQVSEDGAKIQIPYVHFQKRKLTIAKNLNYKDFRIIPNEFVASTDVVNWQAMNKKIRSIIFLLRYYYHIIRNGEVLIHMIYIFRLILFKKTE
jgi:hypothetical protein